MKIFSGSANKPLTKNVANILGFTLSGVEIHVFPDGEKRIQIQERVVDEDCIVVQPTSPIVDSNYMELFFLVDALQRSGAKTITAIVPYLGYQRQDHVFRDGEAVSLEVVIKTLEAVGLTRIVVFDLHSIKIPEFFRIPIYHLSALSLFAQKIKPLSSNAVLVSPDMGGIRRIKMLSEMLGNMPYVAIEKNRDVTSGDVTVDGIHGVASLQGKTRAIIVDDMISSGKTIAIAADLLGKKGIKEIIVFATHAIFSKDAPEILQASTAKKIYVTDTVFIPQAKYFPKLEILSVAGIIAQQLSP